VLHLCLGKCGGIWPSLRIAAVAASHDVAVTLGERVQLGISEAAHAHVAAALPALRFPCALAYDLNEHDLLTESLPKSGAALTVPDGPGLGVDVDEEAVRRDARDD
jgi:L-alanine-DL-glutamate epimerase-like enolase superfamily enzyme